MSRNRITWILGVLLLAGSFSYVAFPNKTTQAAKEASAPVLKPKSAGLIVAAGRVEPLSEEIKIGSELDGKLHAVLVEEGQSIRKGQVLATLENGDYAARIDLAAAKVRELEAALLRVNNGSRTEERREANASVREAEAVLANAKAELDRRSQLLTRGAIARTEYDVAEREYRVAQARVDAQTERQALVHDASRIEDRQRAAAEVERAKAQLAEANALYGKTVIRSPIDGVVLRKKLRTGESVSGKGDTPIVTLGDVHRLRIRVDVDESDVARLSLGQVAWVTAPAYADRKFTGKVVEIGQILGRKNVRTEEPTERVDTKILETLVELDPGQKIPVGLRVDAFIQAK